MEKHMEVHFYRPEPFFGVIDLPYDWEELDYDVQREWLEEWMQENRAMVIEVDEFYAY